MSSMSLKNWGRTMRGSIFAGRGLRRTSRTPSRQNRFRPELLEQFEARITPSIAPFNLISAGTGSLNNTDPNANYHDQNSLATKVGLLASTPTLDASGNNIVLNFQNTGTSPVTVGVAVYQDQQGASPVNLSQEVLLGIQDYTIPAGQSLTVDVGNMCSIQIDTFISSATYQGSTLGSDVVTQFQPNDSLPANAQPPVDAGYNTQGIHGNASGTYPPGLLGTLVSYTQTTGPYNAKTGTYDTSCPPGQCHSEDYWEDNPCQWGLPTYTVNGKTTTGLALGDQFYSVSQLENILNSWSWGNAAVTLGQEEIYAKLNLINDYQGKLAAQLSSVIAALTDGDTDLATSLTGKIGTCGGFVSYCSAAGKDMLCDANTIDPYNDCSCDCGGDWDISWCSSQNTDCGGNNQGSWCSTSWCGSGGNQYGGSCDTGGNQYGGSCYTGGNQYGGSCYTGGNQYGGSCGSGSQNNGGWSGGGGCWS